MLEIIGGIVVSLIMILLSGIKIVKEYDQLVVFRFGKLVDSKGPGMHLVIPLIDQIQTVDTRIVTLAPPVLEEMTLDHVSVKISVVCLFQIVDAKRAISKIENVPKATEELLQTTLRTAVSQHSLKHLVSDRGRMNGNLKAKLDKQTRDWGVKIITIEIKEIKIPREMKKAMLRSKKIAHIQAHGIPHGEAEHVPMPPARFAHDPRDLRENLS